MRRRLAYILSLVFVAAVSAVYFIYDPSKVNFFPPCVFYKLTGYKCSGCGMQRAFHSLLHLDISAALGYNAFLVLLSPLLIALLLSPLWRKRFPAIYAFCSSSVFMIVFVVLTLTWWVLRNIIGL
ncbi:MAG: DUF2752 domain-containing protein [Prevotella sp.]|nr:DUF2752 domain-containing protein [Prevotella sp.]